MNFKFHPWNLPVISILFSLIHSIIQRVDRFLRRFRPIWSRRRGDCKESRWIREHWDSHCGKGGERNCKRPDSQISNRQFENVTFQRLICRSNWNYNENYQSITEQRKFKIFQRKTQDINSFVFWENSIRVNPCLKRGWKATIGKSIVISRITSSSCGKMALFTSTKQMFRFQCLWSIRFRL
jgi:hypothetical protein